MRAMPKSTDRGQPRTPRGRPYRQMGSSTGISDTVLRLAWLLRVNRLLSDDPQWTKTAAFAAAFRGGGYPRSISESTVSRWETGVGRPSLPAVRRYEELLGLPPGLLVAMADTMARYAGSERS